MNIKLSIQYTWLYLLASATVLMGCQAETQNNDLTAPHHGRKSDTYVKAITHHYTVITKADSDPEYGTRVGGARISDFLFTVDATYKEDTFRILLTDLWLLNDLIKKTGLSSDSLLIASLVKGEKVIEFDVNNIYGIDIVRKWKNVDAVKEKGKEYFLDYYFKENGFQKLRGTSDFEIAYIIDILSDWGILVSLDDESGFYYLYDRLPKKENK